MKRPFSPQLAARRREVAILAHPNRAHTGWTQAAIASHLKIPQGTVSRDLAAMREFWRDFSAGRLMRGTNSIDAHKDPVCAYRSITVELCVSYSSVRAFSNSPANAGAEMELENHAGGTTQVAARQSVAATGEAHCDVAGVGKNAHQRI
jgi:hypothetical protein